MFKLHEASSIWRAVVDPSTCPSGKGLSTIHVHAPRPLAGTEPAGAVLSRIATASGARQACVCSRRALAPTVQSMTLESCVALQECSRGTFSGNTSVSKKTKSSKSAHWNQKSIGSSSSLIYMYNGRDKTDLVHHKGNLLTTIPLEYTHTYTFSYHSNTAPETTGNATKYR
jgi:hypothetical protein